MISYLKELNNIGAKKQFNNDDLNNEDAGLSLLGKNLSSKGLEITLTNNKIKDMITVIKSLENGGILLKGTTTKIASQEEGIFNYS